MKKYEEFINESKLQLLLEANISYANNFVEILNDIDNSVIADELRKLNGKEVDVKTNHIALDYDKIDYILFVPDDKYEKLPYQVFGDSHAMTETHYARAARYNGYDIGENNYVPDEESHVEVVKNFTKEEFENLTEYRGDNLFSHIKWHAYGMDRENFYRTDYIRKDLTGIKETPFKIGRFVTNILTKAGIEYSPKDVEAFVDKFKAEMKKKNDIFENFEIVQGEEIRDYYLDDNYKGYGGTLGSSCMRYDNCQKFLDIYVDNPTVSLIIFKEDKDDTSIIGRALLWDATKISTDESIKFMDRIYVNKSNDIELFKQFAIKNGFHYKHKQDYSETPLMFNNQVLSDEDSLIYVDVNAGEYDYYPYVDTVKYYQIYNGILSNSDRRYDKVLTDTDGGNCEICDGRGEIECYECDNDGNKECPECEGSCVENCDDCSGYGIIRCDRCNGSKEQYLECKDCNGEGCENCNEGYRYYECEKCKGKETDECETCEGSGENSCHECEGRGEISCDNCGGRGEYDCPECS